MGNYSTNSTRLKMRLCRRCKTPIDERVLHDYCPDCFKRVEKIFEKIENYLKKYPGATAFEIEQETQVPYSIIQGFIKEGRLLEIPNEYLNVDCLGCGCLLLSAHHRYCPDCREILKKEVEAAGRDLKTKIGGKKAKMHIAGILRSKK